MDFLKFFGLKEDPFKLTPDPAYFYPSSTHNEGLLLLDYSIGQKEGFTTVIGDPGSGKTTLLNVLLQKWKPKAEIAIVLTPRLSPEEFLVSVLEDLKISLRRRNKNEIIKAFRDFMIEKSSEGRWVLIIVDEAQNLPEETLEELRLLSNLETDKDKLLQIILLGQPELETKLKSDRLRQLNQRITSRIHLRHFNPDETIDYINYRLIKAGKQNLQLDKKAGRLAYKLTKGVPRLINMLVLRALMAAYLEGSNIVLPAHISHAVKSLDHSDMRLKNRLGFIPITAVTAGVLLSVVAAMNIYFHRDTAVAPDETIKTAGINLVQNPVEPAAKLKEIKIPAAQSGDHLKRKASGHALKVTVNAAAQGTSESASIPVEEAQLPGYRIVTINVDVANIREKPAPDASKAGWSLKGNQLVVLQEYVDENNVKWYQVPFEGEKRWISEEVVDEMNMPETGVK